VDTTVPGEVVDGRPQVVVEVGMPDEVLNPPDGAVQGLVDLIESGRQAIHKSYCYCTFKKTQFGI
jgi:hypothetical protein